MMLKCAEGADMRAITLYPLSIKKVDIQFNGFEFFKCSHLDILSKILYILVFVTLSNPVVPYVLLKTP